MYIYKYIYIYIYIHIYFLYVFASGCQVSKLDKKNPRFFT